MLYNVSLIWKIVSHNHKLTFLLNLTETETERYTESKRETGGWHIFDLMTLFTKKKNRRGLACHCPVAYARVAPRYLHAFSRVWSDIWIHDSLAKAHPKVAFIMGTQNDNHVLPTRKMALWLALPPGRVLVVRPVWRVLYKYDQRKIFQLWRRGFHPV